MSSLQAHARISSSDASNDASADERTLYDPNSDDEAPYDGRPSGDFSEGDNGILESEDEREKLLMGRKGVKIGKRKEMKEVKRGKSGRRGAEEESASLMYEMDGGIEGSSESLVGMRRGGRHREEDERVGIADGMARKAAQTRLYRRICIYTSITILFVVLLAVAYRLSTPRDLKPVITYISNGTSLFAPTTILISLDGFRADFLYRNLTPTLNQFIQEGISPKYMLPSFPSVTFPNHYTMATGMYPEAHGIVGNTFWDPKLEKEFYYTDPERSLQSHWWGGEPLWVTAERQGVRAAVHMWPGSEAHVDEQEIAYIDKYNGSEILERKVDRIMQLLDTPGPKDIGAQSIKPRPQLIAAYVPDVDGDGHKYGPNSTEIRSTIAAADTMLGSILDGLKARNLTNLVNVVVVSDHGMATTDVSRLIQLGDLIDPTELSHIDGWPLYGLRPKNPSDLHKLYNQIRSRTASNPNVEVYLRDENMPERYHFSRNERIAPLWIIPKAGWAIVDRNEFDVVRGQESGEVYHPRGLHGYDYEHPLMRAIFVARGPAFKHRPGSRMEPFQNIELYNVICDSLGLTPAPNNGTLRLPLIPSGHHSDPDTPSDEIPADPPIHTLPSSPTLQPTTSPIKPTPSLANIPSSNLDTIFSITASASGVDDSMRSIDDAIIRPTAPSVLPGGAEDGTEKEKEEKEKQEELSWWEWITHKADDVQGWVDDFIKSHVPGQQQGEGEGEKKDD